MRRKASGKRAWKTNAATENSISLTSKTTVFSGPASLGGLEGRSRERPFYFSPIGNVNLGFAAMNSLQAQSASTPRKRAGAIQALFKKNGHDPRRAHFFKQVKLNVYSPLAGTNSILVRKFFSPFTTYSTLAEDPKPTSPILTLVSLISVALVFELKSRVISLPSLVTTIM